MIRRLTSQAIDPVVSLAKLEHDPEKWKPVFRKDHASPKR
jgi:hypothetical protein